MEFNFSIQHLLGQTQNPAIAIIDGDQYKKYSYSTSQLSQVIDTAGQKSALAQGLPQVITTLGKVCANGHKIFMKIDGNKFIGFMKIGYKRLFIRNRQGNIIEINPLSVLDFYVNEQVQRGGHGKEIFEKMLSNEGLNPAILAYDRPSPKLKAFLAKHYNLRNFVAQNNNFVVFDEYFDENQNMTYIQQKQNQNRDPLLQGINNQHKNNTVTNFQTQSNGQQRNQGKMLSQLGRELVQNRNDNKALQMKDHYQYSTNSDAFQNQLKQQQMVVNPALSRQGIYDSSQSQFQGYSPFKVFSTNQQSSNDQKLPQYIKQHQNYHTKHYSINSRHNTNSNSNQYLSSFYGDFNKINTNNNVAHSQLNWYKKQQQAQQQFMNTSPLKFQFNKQAYQQQQPIMLKSISRY